MSGYFNDFDCSIKNNAYEYLGSFLSGDAATFRVWAPNAKSVRVAGDFNGWNYEANYLNRISGGVWETVVFGIKNFDTYKYAIEDSSGKITLKSDP
ncbi:MAG: hypothetical protein J6T73_05010, partial [Clostridia bacterium]|nr:hypothetical protein [Clostridia bacterium]